MVAQAGKKQTAGPIDAEPIDGGRGRSYTAALLDLPPIQIGALFVASNQEWQDLAACREIAVELFFPPAEQESEVAKAVCAECTVRQPCLEFALAEGERFGIWGGLSSQERRSVAAKRRKTGLTTMPGVEVGGSPYV